MDTRGLVRRRICFRSFLSRQNPLNRNMGQNNVLLASFSQPQPGHGPYLFPGLLFRLAFSSLGSIRGIGRRHLWPMCLWIPFVQCDKLHFSIWFKRDSIPQKTEKPNVRPKNTFCHIWRFRGFWRDRNERKHILRRNSPRVSNFLSHRIVESLRFMFFDILGKFPHHQMILGPPDGSLDSF